MNLTEEEITYPEDEPNPRLIAIYTASKERGIELREILLAGSFAVIGTFSDNASLVKALNTYEIVATIYDTRDNYEGTFTFLNTIKRLPHMPVILVGPLDHTINRKLTRIPNKFSEIKFPFTSQDVLEKVKNLIGGETTGIKRPTILVNYINKVLSDMVIIAPRELKATIKEVIVYNITQLIQRTNVLDKDTESASSITLYKNVEAESLFEPFKNFFSELVEHLEQKIGQGQGSALVKDALFQAFFSFRKSMKFIERFLIYCGYTELDFAKPLSQYIRDDSTKFNVKTAFFILEDIGPAILMETKKEIWPELFNDLTASQYISLVGQGENYHEGLYGPFPSGNNPELMVLIYSKRLEDSSIIDERLKGKTLAIVALGFPHKIQNILPARFILAKVFHPFLSVSKKQEMSIEILEAIERNFLSLFTE